MRKLLSLLAISVAGVACYAIFLHIPVCMTAATYRVHLFSQVGLCSPFVDISLEQVRIQFDDNVKVGDDRVSIENGLTQIGAINSWDRFQNRYQGIIRHPSSNFHAIVIYVYVDSEAKYERIEVSDSFTAL